MLSDIVNFLRLAVKEGASDIFIVSGLPISFKKNGAITSVADEIVMPALADELVSALYRIAGRQINEFTKSGDDEFSISVKGLSRFRVITYMQRGSMAAVIRVVNFEIPDYKKLGIPDEIINIASYQKGLVLVTGTEGSGKSTTLACITDAINKTRSAHIITIEDPIEYLHKNIKSAISQREVGSDTKSYAAALRACLRQVPDVIVIGELSDPETFRMAMTAAETGHLVISTMQTVGAVSTISRIIDIFPPDQQQHTRIQLSLVLNTIVSQQLIPRESGGLIPAFEIMHINSMIRSLIRESLSGKIASVIENSSAEGMTEMDAYILNLYHSGEINRENALNYAVHTERVLKEIVKK